MTTKQLAALTLSSFFFLSVFSLCVNPSASAVLGALLLKQGRLLPVYSVETAEKKIAITFDCAWGVEFTDSILRTLELTDTRATFFTVEFWTEKYPEYVQKIHLLGNEIGTHSATHSYMSKLSPSEISAELTSSARAIEQITHQKVDLFRPPYGDYDDDLIETASALGFFTIQWDVDSLDWKDLSATDITLRIVNNVQHGSIILCHNNALHTAEALPMIIDTLHNKGYTFVTVGELIYRQSYTIDEGGRQKQRTNPSTLSKTSKNNRRFL